MSASSSYSNDVTSLHKAIEENEIDEVKLLLSKLPVDKHYFDLNNTSAAAVAIKCEKHKIYELLVARGIFLGPHEWMDEATSGQERSSKVNLREIHKKYFNDPNLKHLANLITSTKLSPDALSSDRREHLRLITEAFEDLNGLRSIEPILKVASTSQKLQIVFDFNNDSVEFVDPTQNKDAEGYCYHKEGIIYVGAKDLKEKEKRCEVLGTLIHELTHFVMQLVYDNGAKPYHYGNEEKFNEFKQVVDKTAEIVKKTEAKDTEPYIKIVYNYPVSQHHAELIVRVPHLTALYKDDADKINKVQEKFSELFYFYEENTLVDLKREFPLMEVINEIRELNKLCGTLAILGSSDIETSPQALNVLDINSLSNDKFLFIPSNCPQLTLSAFLQQVCTEIDFGTSFIFADFKSLINEKIFGLAAKSLELFTKPLMIIDCHCVVNFDEVMRIVNKLNENKINQKIIFIIDKKFEDSCDAEPFKVVLSWNHLTRNFKKYLLEKKAKFLGTEMVVGKLLNDLSSIESIPFQDLLDDKTIVIGKNLEFETEKMIERRFLPPNSEMKSWEQYTIELDLDELLTVTKEHQTILISDEPGMGKSTSFKMLHSKLKQRNPTLWLVFMDLKDHFKAYDVSGLEVRKREDIAKFFTEKVLKIESFEAQIFTKLFNEDRVVLLMDGLDEICPSYKQFIFSLMKDVQKFSKNQLWISTRPHLVAKLRTELNPIEFTLKPFTEANRREFFEKHFIGDLNFELILIEIESFLGKLWPYVCNPLVMSMIVEILNEDRSLNLSEANLFVIYDRFTRKMIGKCQNKGSEARKDVTNSFGNSTIVKFYQQQAFLTCFIDEGDTLMMEKLIDPQFDHVEKPSLDEIVRIGLMLASSSENLHFIHQTFAESYVAKFFYEAIFKSRKIRSETHLNATIEFLLKIVLERDEFNFIRILLDSAIESDQIPRVTEFPPSTLEVVQKNMELKHFRCIVRSGCYNLIKFFVLHLHPDGQKLLFSREIEEYFNRTWTPGSICKPNLLTVAVENQSLHFIKRFFDLLGDLNTEKFKNMLFQIDFRSRNTLVIAALNPSSEVFKYIFDLCESFMTNEQLIKLLMPNYELEHSLDVLSKTNIFHSAIWNNRNVDFIMNVLTQMLSPAQQKTLLVEVSHRRNNTLLQLVIEHRNSVANFEGLFAFIKKVLDPQDLENFLFHENQDGRNAFDLALLYKNELFFSSIRKFYLEVFGEKKMREIIFEGNKCENWFQESSLHFQRICQADMVGVSSYFDGAFKRFISFIMELFAADKIQKEFFLIKNNNGETFLEFAMKTLGKDDFAFLCSLLNTNDRVEILQQMNSRGECAFHSSAKLDDLKRFRKVQQLYEESFDSETFRQMIVGCDKSWILDVLEYYITSPYEPSGTFEELCHCLRDLFEGTDETEKLKDFFLFADNRVQKTFPIDTKLGQTAFMAAAKGRNKEFEHLFAITKKLYNNETVKEFLLLKDKEGAIAFSYSFMSGEDKTIESVRSIFEELFGPEKMQELFMAKVSNENILCHIIGHSLFNPERFERLCKLIIKLFDGEAQNLKYTFFSVDHGRTVLMKAAEQHKYNCFKNLVDVIEKIFVEEEIVKMLCQRNFEGITAFHFAIGNNEEIFETVKNFYFKTLGNEAMKNIISDEFDWTLVIKDYNLNISIKRLVPVLKNLFEVHAKNIIFKIFPEKAIEESMKHESNESNALIISYLKEQFQDDRQMKKFIIKLENNSKSLTSHSDSDSSSNTQERNCSLANRFLRFFRFFGKMM